MNRISSPQARGPTEGEDQSLTRVLGAQDLLRKCLIEKTGEGGSEAWLGLGEG